MRRRAAIRRAGWGHAQYLQRGHFCCSFIRPRGRGPQQQPAGHRLAAVLKHSRSQVCHGKQMSEPLSDW
eukprot:2069007-Pyramimonas_sp.AAC.1